MIGISDFAGVYLMCHDGWNGTLHLGISGSPPSLSMSKYIDSSGREFSVQATTSDYQVTFYILGLGDQNADGTGGQKFQGYLMTQTKDAIAGITWWQDHPFGFYAVKQ